MSGATPVMMAVDIQMRDIPNLRSLITSMMRAIKQSAPTDHLLALIALSMTPQRFESCCLLY